MTADRVCAIHYNQKGKGNPKHQKGNKMFYVTVSFLQFGKKGNREEAEKLFAELCERYPHETIAIRNEAGYAVKERFAQRGLF